MYPWQKELKSRLCNELEKGKLPHALLFAGNKFLGKNDFAYSFAKTIMCKTKNDCGSCRTCIMLAAESNPDILLVTAEKKIINVEQIREVNNFLQQKAVIAEAKVVIIEDADKLNSAASNALLKTLEEPKVTSYIILTCSNPEKLLPTIKSRVQKYLFKAPSKKQALDYMRIKASASEDKMILSLSLSGNSPLGAIEKLEGNYFSERDIILDDLFAYLNKEKNSIEIVEAWTKLDVKNILEILQSIVVDIIYIKEKAFDRVLNLDVKDKLSNIVNKNLDRTQNFLNVYQKLNLHSKELDTFALNKELLLYSILDDVF